MALECGPRRGARWTSSISTLPREAGCFRQEAARRCIGAAIAGLIVDDAFTSINRAPPLRGSTKSTSSPCWSPPDTMSTVERLTALDPRTLAIMHGPSFRGDGGAAIARLSAVVTKNLGNREA
jgi:hypothetical protein